MLLFSSESDAKLPLGSKHLYQKKNEGENKGVNWAFLKELPKRGGRFSFSVSLGNIIFRVNFKKDMVAY